MSRRLPLRAALIASAMLVSMVGLAGCVGGGDAAPSTTATTAPPSASPSVSASPTAAPAPSLDPEGTAAENLPFFNAVVQAVWAGPDRAAGRAYIDALVAAGFDKSAMQVTADQTTIGNPVDSLQFSVRWGDQCLIGQAGPEIGEAVTVVERALEGGACLVGKTRPIDW